MVKEFLCDLRTLSSNINFQSGFELHSEVVFPDGYLSQPAFYQGFIEGLKVGMLLFNVILQVVDSFNLCISGGGVNGALLALFAELENLVGNLIISSYNSELQSMICFMIHIINCRNSILAYLKGLCIKI
ncbi:MAG: hypothetical protein ACI4DP_02175 [Candidatus Ornithomonoglobus sp.]